MFGKLQIKSSVHLLILGFVSMVVQIAILREYIVLFSGNELVIGISLFAWMVFTGTGTWIVRYIPQRLLTEMTFPLLLPAMSTLALASVWAAYNIRYNFFLPGRILDIPETVWIASLCLLPICLATGLSFGIMNRVICLHYNKNTTSFSYGIESLGAAIGGVTYYLAMASSNHNITIIRFVFILCILYGIIQINFRIRASILTFVMISTAGILLFITDIDLPAEQQLYAGQEILANEDTKFGNLVVTKSQEQINIYQDGTCTFFTNNIEDNEEKVHFAMLQHPHPQKILVISGGGSGMLKEITKYKPSRIDYVEENKAVIRNISRFTANMEDVINLHIFISDPRKYLTRTHEKYDIILIHQNEPSTIQANRFYTSQFFRLLKKRLNPTGIISFQVSATTGYLSENTLNILSIIHNTLKTSFNEVLILPGNKYNFIASEKTGITARIAGLYDIRSVTNEYVNPYYIDDELITSRSGEIMDAITVTGINRDEKPMLLYHQLSFFLSQFRIEIELFLGIIFFSLLIFIFLAGRNETGLFIIGFTSISVELLALIVLQTLLGQVYLYMGLFFAIYMAGLFLGSTKLYPFLSGYRNKKRLLFTGVLMVCIACVFLLYLGFLQNSLRSDWIIVSVLALIVAAVAVITGMYFSVSSMKITDPGNPFISKVYSTDLWGSAAGSLVSTCLVIPLFGLFSLAILLVATSLFMTIFYTFTKGG